MPEQHSQLKCAPVVIPTLNRYTHLRRCVESLEDNTWAEYTDVFISVDFPPEEKYEEGHKKVVEYLKKKENNNSFKSLNLYFQKTNYL